MAELTRRTFLKTGAATGAASVGGFAIGPGLAAALLGSAGVAAGDVALHDGSPVVAYVRDAGRGELGLLVGEREVTVRDPKLVARLLASAR